MSPIDYQIFKNGRGGDPAEGTHQASLERATISNDERAIITEWSSKGCWWSSWFQLQGRGLPFTLDMLDGLGIDRDALDPGSRPIEDALADAENILYTVNVTYSNGTDGRRFINTTVDGPADAPPAQQPLTTDVPVPAGDFVAGPALGDDDIPF